MGLPSVTSRVSLLVLFIGLAVGDTIYLSGVLRDQAPAAMWQCGGNPGEANGGAGFSDTDFQISGYTPDEKGLVGPECNAVNGWHPPACGQLASDLTPIYAYTGQSPGKNIQSPASFYKWFHDSNETRDVSFAIPLAEIGTSASYTYVNDSFFPLDGLGWKDHCNNAQDIEHNFSYCFESHSRFGFSGNEVFDFYGDDDVWVFIDNRLVIDLGSLHTKLAESITLSNIAGLTPGGTYRMDFFYCERHTTESNMEITTTLQFYCAYTDWCGVCEGTGQSCCTAAVIAQYCNDNNACTTDTCAATTSPANGGCVHTNVTCPVNNDHCKTQFCDVDLGCSLSAVNCDDGNPCTVDSCDSSVGCQHTAKVCNDNNVCTTDSCGADGNCVFSDNSARCNDNNLCTTDACSPSGGCTNVAVNCNDNNACTVDTCAPSTGCVHNPAPACNDNNLCTNDSCVAATGCQYVTQPCTPPDKCSTAQCTPSQGCVLTPVNCDDGLKCTIDTCSPTAGCLNTPVNCDDGNACTTDACSAATGNCTHTSIGDNCGQCGAVTCTYTDNCNPSVCDKTTTTCKVQPVVCNDSNACTTDSCNSTAAGAQCIFTPITCVQTDACNPLVCDRILGCQPNPVVCNDNNNCTTDTCGSTTGSAVCAFAPVNCPTTDACNPASCDAATGQCITTPVDCDDKNACTADQCVVVGGNATCTHTGKTCGDACNPAVCNTTTGLCVSQPRSCDDNNPCTLDAAICLNSTTPSCNHTLIPNPCNDSNACTNDYCNASGSATDYCYHSNITCTPNICQVYNTCSPLGGCQFSPRVCPNANDFCLQGACDLQAGCITINKVCTSTDPGCYQSKCNSTLAKCVQTQRQDFATSTSTTKQPGTLCALVYNAAAKKGAISAGVIAGVVIGCVVAAALIGLGGKAGYDFLQARSGAMGNTQSNPLYEQSSGGGNNPMYT